MMASTKVLKACRPCHRSHIRCFASKLEIPVIDVSVFSASSNANHDAKMSAARELYRACSELGVFYVTGHDISHEDRSKVFKCASDLFSLSDRVKQSVKVQSGGFARGYIGFGAESGSNRLECKEGYSYGYDWQRSCRPENNMQGPNQWPDKSVLDPDFIPTMNGFYSNIVLTSERVIRGLSLALGFKECHLPAACVDGDTISLMRLFHYFPYEQLSPETALVKGEKIETEAECIGSSPHTDWGFLTAIVQDNQGGLQVLYLPLAMILDCTYFSLYVG